MMPTLIKSYADVALFCHPCLEHVRAVMKDAG